MWLDPPPFPLSHAAAILSLIATGASLVLSVAFRAAIAAVVERRCWLGESTTPAKVAGVVALNTAAAWFAIVATILWHNLRPPTDVPGVLLAACAMCGALLQVWIHAGLLVWIQQLRSLGKDLPVRRLRISCRAPLPLTGKAIALWSCLWLLIVLWGESVKAIPQ